MVRLPDRRHRGLRAAGSRGNSGTATIPTVMIGSASSVGAGLVSVSRDRRKLTGNTFSHGVARKRLAVNKRAVRLRVALSGTRNPIPPVKERPPRRSASTSRRPCSPAPTR